MPRRRSFDNPGIPEVPQPTLTPQDYLQGRARLERQNSATPQVGRYPYPTVESTYPAPNSTESFSRLRDALLGVWAGENPHLAVNADLNSQVISEPTDVDSWADVFPNGMSYYGTPDPENAQIFRATLRSNRTTRLVGVYRGSNAGQNAARFLLAQEVPTIVVDDRLWDLQLIPSTYFPQLGFPERTTHA